MLMFSYFIVLIGWGASVLYYAYSLPSNYRDLRENHGRIFSVGWCLIDGMIDIGVTFVLGMGGVEYVATRSMTVLAILNVISTLVIILIGYCFVKIKVRCED